MFWSCKFSANSFERKRGQEVFERASVGEVLVALAFQPHLAPEHSVDEEEIPERENHANDPPSEAHAKPVVSSGCIVDGQAARWIRGCGENHGIQTKCSTNQHS